MADSWNETVRGEEVLPLINADIEAIRVVAGPGTGKTFGLVRRVERILHPKGLAANGDEVLVVAFNRVIAKQLAKDIAARLETFEHDRLPIIRTIHALCLDVIGERLRLLMEHEREAMIYDIIEKYPAIGKEHGGFYKTRQALRDHEAQHAKHQELWMAAREWLDRHQGHLVSDLPGLMLDRLKAGDFPEQAYPYVIVDEFQDLTPGEQELMFKLRQPNGGQLVALGDPRQSIYAFRGNDREGLSKLEALVATYGGGLLDVPMVGCQRCPKAIVTAANQLMTLSGVEKMVPTNDTPANIHVVTWKNPSAEADGMAAAILRNIQANPADRHLAMVTRRRFGYLLRDRLAALDPALAVEMSFSEGLLESWAAREAFLTFCLLVDPDRPTWRAWFAYKNSPTGDSTTPERSAGAYLQFLAASNDAITDASVEALVAEPRTKPRGKHGTVIWDRAQRFLELKEQLTWDGANGAVFVGNVFNQDRWLTANYDEEDRASAALDVQLLHDTAMALLSEEQVKHADHSAEQQLRAVAQRLRHKIATREPITAGEAGSLQVATLWGAKGVTAEHVYILGICGEAIPGQRRDDYPGTEAEYVNEQRRLFYVSITRCRKTLVLSRPLKVKRGDAPRLGLSVKGGWHPFWADLSMSPFFREVIDVLPQAVEGVKWEGC